MTIEQNRFHSWSLCLPQINKTGLEWQSSLAILTKQRCRDLIYSYIIKTNYLIVCMAERQIYCWCINIAFVMLCHCNMQYVYYANRPEKKWSTYACVLHGILTCHMVNTYNGQFTCLLHGERQIPCFRILSSFCLRTCDL